MPNTIREDETKVISKDSANNQKLVDYIVSSYKKFDAARQEHLKKADILINLLERDSIAELEFDTDVNTDDNYELKESLRANLRQYFDDSADKFAVNGKDEQSDKTSPTQKQHLVHIIREMNYDEQFKEAIENYLIYGEMIFFVGWEEKIKKIRREKKLEEKDRLSQLKQLMFGIEKKETVIENKLIYKGAKVYNIESPNFVWDTSKKDFDNAFKAYKKELSFEEIKSQDMYTLDDAALKGLDDKNKSDNEDSESNDIVIIEAWGNFKLSDGTILNNYVVAIADNKYVIRCEPNPYIMNPFVISILLKSKKYKRGISPIDIAVVHNLVSSFILKKMLQILWLIVNPPMFIDENGDSSQFQKDKTLKPGQLIKVDGQSGFMPQRLDFSSGLIGFDFIDRFKSMMQALTGIFPYMSGLSPDNDKTATEANIMVNGQQVRLMMIVNEMQDFHLLNIEKIAEITANYEFGDKEIYTNNGDKKESVKIDDEIRQGNYKYEYTDRKNFYEKKQEADQFSLGVNNFAQAGAPVNINETFKYWLENQGIANTEKFINSSQLDTMLRQLPPEFKGDAENFLASVLQQKVQEVQMMEQQGQGITE